LLKKFNVCIGLAVEGVIWGLSESQWGEHLQQKQAKEQDGSTSALPLHG
jgi:hypothetical protein